MITGPRPGGLYALGRCSRRTRSAAARERRPARARASSSATVAGINGDFFTRANAADRDRDPGGALAHGRACALRSIGIERPATSTSAGSRSPAPGRDRTAPAARRGQPGAAGRTRPCSSRRPGAQATPDVGGRGRGRARAVSGRDGNTDLTAHRRRRHRRRPDADPGRRRGARLDRRGRCRSSRRRRRRTGTVTVRLILPPSWSSVVSALGGGPLLVAGGKPVFHTGEGFDAADRSPHATRVPQSASSPTAG